MQLSPGPREFLVFAAVLAVAFAVGLKKKPEPSGDGQWTWWTAMTVFAICIVYLLLRGFGVDVLGAF